MKLLVFRKHTLYLLLVLFTAIFFRAAFALEVRTLVVAFRSDDKDLGRSVATILNLQLWKTLQIPAETENMGMIAWLGEPLVSSTHEAASQNAKVLPVLAQHVLWGDVETFRDGALVYPNLTLPEYNDFRRETEKHEKWRVDIAPEFGGGQLSIDIPRRHYTFEPLLLPASFTEQYSTPYGLEIYSNPRREDPIGRVGYTFTRLEDHRAFSKVISEGKVGWVYLPELITHHTEIIDFVGGIIRIYRGDWAGAEKMLSRLGESRSMPNELLIDALLLRIRAKSEMGQDASELISRVLIAEPMFLRSIHYITQYLIRACFGVSRQPDLCTNKNRRLAVDLLNKNNKLFQTKDLWRERVVDLFERMK